MITNQYFVLAMSGTVGVAVNSSVVAAVSIDGGRVGQSAPAGSRSVTTVVMDGHGEDGTGIGVQV